MSHTRPQMVNTGKPPATEDDVLSRRETAAAFEAMIAARPRLLGRRDFPADRAGEIAFRAYLLTQGTETTTPLPPPPPDPADPHASRTLTLDEALAEMAAARRGIP